MSTGEVSKKIIFTDVRNIACGDLQWISPEEKLIPLIAPPEPAVQVYARPAHVPRGIRLAAQQAQKSESLQVVPDRRSHLENGIYRSWRLAVDYPPGKNFGSYSTADPLSVVMVCSESTNGIDWQEKARCPVKVPGQTSFDGFTFFIDTKKGTNERYKAVYTARAPKSECALLWKKFQEVHPRHKDLRIREDRLYCMYGLVSSDGLHWEPVPEPLMIHISDTDTNVYYDTWLERYVMYTRLYWQKRRWVGRAEAEDFRHWGPVEPLLWPDLGGELSDDIYTNCRTTYPGLPGYHLMFPMIYHRRTQTSEVHFYSSADGVCWMKVPGGPVVTPGAPGEWDSEFVSVGGDLVPAGNDRIALRYHGTSFPHKYPRWDFVPKTWRSGWVWWQKDRLCAVVADGEGEFCTFPLVPAGRELRLNARTRHAGMIQVGIEGVVPGRAVADCDPIIGDSLSHAVHWKGCADTGVTEGSQAIIRFKLRNAEVFALEWV